MPGGPFRSAVGEQWHEHCGVGVPEPVTGSQSGPTG
jgi:hypothetical protein